jgi:hypothetical protein
MAAFAGLKAFTNLREQRSSQMRHPKHFEASILIGRPFLGAIKLSLSRMRLLLILLVEGYLQDVPPDV